MIRRPVISIIIPAYNSAVNLNNFFNSCLKSDFQDFEIIINDDKRSDDVTPEIIRKFLHKLHIIYKIENISMAQGRKKGAEYASGRILLHLDSDMELSRGLLNECVSKIDKEKYDALVIPEESFGTTFWARCKWLEKKCYEGNDRIESLRCLTRKLYIKIGSHNSDMVFSEDKDLDLRVRQSGARVGRTDHHLRHNEGNLRLIRTLSKKLKYSETSNIFALQHPSHYAWQTNIMNRYILYFKKPKILLAHPFLAIGLLFMKTAEFAAGALGLLLTKIELKRGVKS